MKKVLWAVVAVASVGCGEAKELEERIQSWGDSGPIEQRHQKCQDEDGTWVAKITVAACENGKSDVEIQADPNDTAKLTLTLDCQKGGGGEYTDQCMHMDDAQRPYWNDGPSTPNIAQAVSGYFGDGVNQLNWNDLFWAAARNHDYCYHSGVSRGLVKDDCDNQFHADMKYVCTQPQSADKTWFSVDNCNLESDGMYEAVHSQGDTAYNVMGTVADYPEWQAPPET